MISTGALHTLLFVLLNLLMLSLLVGCSPTKSGFISIHRLAIGAAMPVIAIGLIFWAGEGGGDDKSVTIKINQFHVPFENVTAKTGDDDEQKVYFVAGEKPEHSDLVVKPYADQIRAAEFVRDEPRPILKALADRNGEVISVKLCRFNQSPSADLELPGWEVRYSKHGDELPAAPPGSDCSYELKNAGDSVDVALFRVDQNNDGEGENLFKERRSFSVTRGQDALRIRLDTPVSIDVRECRSERFRLLPGMPLAETIGFLPPQTIRPAQIGTGGVNPVLEPRYIGDAMEAGEVCGGTSQRFSWPSTASDPTRFSGSITRNFIPWFLVILFAANSAALFILRSGWWRMERLEACAVLTIQWMLMLRTIIGAAGLYANANLVRANVLLDAGMAYVCLPAMAVLLLMKKGSATRQTSLVMAGLVAASYAALIIALGTSVTLSEPLIYGLMTLALAVLRAFAPWNESLVTRVFALLAGLTDHRKLWNIGLMLILVCVVLRAALMFVGAATPLPAFTERVWILPLSTFYQPAMIIGFAMLLIATVQKPSWLRALGIGALWGLSGVLIPMMIGDFGIVWIFSWPLAMVISWFAIHAIVNKEPVTGIMLAPLSIVPFTVFAMAFYWSAQPFPQPADVTETDDSLGAHLQIAVDWNSRDQVRLMRYSAPEKLELLGNRMSFEMLDQAASLEPLVRDFWGQGYLKPSLIKNPVRKYQFNDNLLPVHIAWPFGRFGLMTVLVFVAGSAGLLVPRIAPGSASVATAISSMAAVTIAWAAIYMALANLNLAPFTGRNVFLLAVTSGGDAIEGLVMMLMASAAAASGAVFNPPGSSRP